VFFEGEKITPALNKKKENVIHTGKKKGDGDFFASVGKEREKEGKKDVNPPARVNRERGKKTDLLPSLHQKILFPFQ